TVARRINESLDRRGARFPNCRNDAAARRKYLKVFRAFDLHLKLVQPIAGVNDMRVRIDKTWTYNVAARIDVFVTLKLAQNIVRSSNRSKLSVSYRNSAVLENSHIEHRLT